MLALYVSINSYLLTTLFHLLFHCWWYFFQESSSLFFYFLCQFWELFFSAFASLVQFFEIIFCVSFRFVGVCDLGSLFSIRGVLVARCMLWSFSCSPSYILGYFGFVCSVLGFWSITLVSSSSIEVPLRWCHNERNGVSIHRRLDCLFNRLSRHRSKKTAKLRVTGLCEGNLTGTGEPVVSLTKGLYRGKCFHLMTPSCGVSLACHI